LHKIENQKTMKKIFSTVIAITLFLVSYSQNHSDANLIGHVVSKGEHIPFVNVYLEDTNYGTATDVTGHYMMVDLPQGKFIVIAKMVGYKIQKKEVELKAGETVEVKFDLEEEVIRMDEVVITGTKTFKRQTESAVIVNVLDSRTIEMVQFFHILLIILKIYSKPGKNYSIQGSKRFIPDTE